MHEGVAIVSTCPKILHDFKTDVFEVDPLIVITSIPFPRYQVLTSASTRSSMEFKHSFDFLSPFSYFARLFLVSTWEIR